VALILIAGLGYGGWFIARKTKPPKEKPGLTFGGLADDTGDFVSFALAPAFILFLLGEYIAAVVYLLATSVRLYFFTESGEEGKSISGVFRGFPSPAAAISWQFPALEHPISPRQCDHRNDVGRARSGFFVRWYHFG